MIFVFSLLATITLIVMIYMPGISLVGMFVLSFVTGIFLSVQLLTYSMAIELNPIMSKGASLAITNFFVFLGGALIQMLVGFLIDKHWTGQVLGGIPFYTIADYHYALLCFPAATLLASILTLFLNEKKYSSLRKVKSPPPVDH